MRVFTTHLADGATAVAGDLGNRNVKREKFAQKPRRSVSIERQTSFFLVIHDCSLQIGSCACGAETFGLNQAASAATTLCLDVRGRSQAIRRELVNLACQSRTLALRLRKLPLFIRIFCSSPRNAGCCAVHLTVELDAAMQAVRETNFSN